MKLYLMCFFLLYEFCEISATADISKMSMQFMVKWGFTEDEFFAQPRNLTRFGEWNYVRETLFNFTDVKNLSFNLRLLRKEYGKKFQYKVTLLPEYSRRINETNGAILDYAFLYSAQKYYLLKNSKQLLPTEPVEGYLSAEHYKMHFFQNDTATIHCKIRVKTKIETHVPTRNHAQFKSYFHEKFPSLKINFYEDKNFIDDYIYSGELPALDTQKAIFVLLNANSVQQLDAGELINWSEKYLMQNMSESNAVDILNVALKTGRDSLREQSLRYIKTAFRQMNDKLSKCSI